MMNNNKVKVFNTAVELAESLSSRLKEEINQSSNIFNLAISGGSTPKVLFNNLADEVYRQSINWSNTNIWWCDERCVPPEDSESNFGMTKKILLNNISIPAENIHKIKGEDDPSREAVRYAMDIEKVLCEGRNCLPEFDRVLLGIGEDGHTASIFPGKNLLFLYSNIVGVAQHPVTGQKRITLTKEVLNNAKEVTFVVTGKAKAKILSEIISNHPVSKNYPAAEIKLASGDIEWLIDKEAAFYL